MSKIHKQPCTPETIEAELTALRQDLLAEYDQVQTSTSPQQAEAISTRQAELSQRIEEIADQIIKVSQKAG